MGLNLQYLKWLGLAVVLVGCGSSTKTEIPKMAINTENARLVGYLEGIQDESCSPVCTKIPREVDVDDSVVLDEALLIEADKNTCFDVIVRTTLGYDRSINQLAPVCRLDSAVEPADVLTETFTVFAYGNLTSLSTAEGGASSDFAVLAADMTQSDLNTKAGEETTVLKHFGADSAYSGDQLRVVQRKSRVCCPGTGQSSVELTLSNGIDPGNEEEDLAQAVDFVWLLTEN